MSLEACLAFHFRMAPVAYEILVFRHSFAQGIGGTVFINENAQYIHPCTAFVGADEHIHLFHFSQQLSLACDIAWTPFHNASSKAVSYDFLERLWFPSRFLCRLFEVLYYAWLVVQIAAGSAIGNREGIPGSQACLSPAHPVTDKPRAFHATIFFARTLWSDGLAVHCVDSSSTT